VKIGRSNKWYPHDEGLKKDIEVVNTIYSTFKDRGVEILVDANDGYSLQDCIDFLTGIQGVPLFWFEEPFREDPVESKKLRDWMHANGFEKTFFADGELKPDHDECMLMAEQGILDVYLADVVGFGFTPWRRTVPLLGKFNTFASPHGWGTAAKTNYATHLSAGLGRCCTIEGVTCTSDEIDFGNYPLVNGMITVSDAPGFGMKLLV
jgi:L-alanine-DL-glutamate epimerase-like enolase superfamily enzyme